MFVMPAQAGIQYSEKPQNYPYPEDGWIIRFRG
jgi:hypothetical protein